MIKILQPTSHLGGMLDVLDVKRVEQFAGSRRINKNIERMRHSNNRVLSQAETLPLV